MARIYPGYCFSLRPLAQEIAIMETKKKQILPEVTFEYKISQNYVVYAITGVFGGLNAQGQVIMNLFNERHAIPKTQTHAILPDGTLSPTPISEDKKKHVIRDVMLGISISPDTARTFANWLIERADQFEKLAKERGGIADVKIDKDYH
jgi:hypothetical protein